MISAGHSLDSIGDYSLAQLEIFNAAIGAAEKHVVRNALIVARAAQADEKSFKKILKEFG